jgi:hypothetical protein
MWTTKRRLEAWMRSVVRRNARALAAAALAVAAVAGVTAERSYTGGNFQADGAVTEPGGTSLITEVGFPATRHEHGPENFQAE